MKRSNNVANVATVKGSELPKCWVRRGNDYVLTAQGGKETKRYLPCVGIQYEEVLKSLEIPYEVIELPDKKDSKKINQVCRYWNPVLYEEEKITRPVYKLVQSRKDTYIKTNEVYTGKVMTRAAINMAMKVKETVSQAVELYKANQRIIRRGEFLRKQMGTKSAMVITGNFAEETIAGIKVLAGYHADGTPNGYYAIFDMEKLQNVSEIKLNVAKEVASKVIGKGGRNSQYWEYELGKKIKVNPI